MVIDSHCHVSPDWYEPVESLLYQMDRNDIEKAVLVQMLGEFDNRYQQACIKKFPDRFASVVGIDVHSSSACDQLEQLVEEGACGLRLRPMARSKGDDPFAVWRKAEALSLAVSCVGNPESFSSPEFIEVIEAHPELIIVLEHLGGTSSPDSDQKAINARKQVHKLARYPHVFIKMTGLGELLPRDQLTSLDRQNYVETVTSAYQYFGAERMMWGSDFPPVSAREGYRNAIGWSLDLFAEKPLPEIEQIFAGTANRIFFNHE